MAVRLSSRVWNQQLELTHVPRGCRTPLGAETTVETHVFIFDHYPFRLGQRARREEVLRRIHRGCGQMRPKIEIIRVVGCDRQAVHRTYVDARVALDAEVRAEVRLDVA